ncbi:MAG: hypothetical protein IPJ00_12150 [Saprospirales bacterium]|mgnify:CR=1 FL=1|jgi:hypothetical protein|nr:hypothetical protein [Saprospirales bacterium]MBK7336865.1 hypothetical protein [Saprospirales bacterium]
MDPEKELIVKDFELIAPNEEWTEEEFFIFLSDHIAYLIEHKLEYLLSLMYRLDVNEAKVHDALSPFAPEAANIGIARLVIERQRQRVATKQFYKQAQPEDMDEDLAL